MATLLSSHNLQAVCCMFKVLIHDSRLDVFVVLLQALLELKGRLLVEAALEEVVSLIAAHLDVLQVPTRMSVLQRLWPMIALLQSPTDRLTAFAHSWRAALELALSSTAANTLAGKDSLSHILMWFVMLMFGLCPMCLCLLYVEAVCCAVIVL